jgi:hypothetical protein
MPQGASEQKLGKSLSNLAKQRGTSKRNMKQKYEEERA